MSDSSGRSSPSCTAHVRKENRRLDVKSWVFTGPALSVVIDTATTLARLELCRRDSVSGGREPWTRLRVLDDVDQLVGVVSMASGVGDEFFGAGDDGALVGGTCDGDSSASAEFEQSFVSE